MKENSITLTLKLPPSLNQLFAGFKIRHKSNIYKQWILNSKIEFNKLDTNYRIIGDEWLEVELHYYFSLYTKKGKKRIKDVDNFSKATLDFLGDNLEGFKDEYIKVLKLEKHNGTENIVKIIIKELEKSAKK